MICKSILYSFSQEVYKKKKSHNIDIRIKFIIIPIMTQLIEIAGESAIENLSPNIQVGEVIAVNALFNQANLTDILGYSVTILLPEEDESFSIQVDLGLKEKNIRLGDIIDQVTTELDPVNAQGIIVGFSQSIDQNNMPIAGMWNIHTQIEGYPAIFSYPYANQDEMDRLITHISSS
jgi:hypothetical protein